MAQPTAPHLRSLYRRLLRELPSRPTSGPSPIQRRIRSQFEDKNNAASQTSVEAVEQMTQYLHAQRTYTTLVERYNPGMNMSEEERTRLSARRVGMEMPKVLQAMLGASKDDEYGGSGGGSKS